MSSFYSELGWLPRPPADFNQQCRSLFDKPEDVPAQIRRLASTALDENQLVRLSRTIQKLRSSDHSLAPLTPYRLAILSNSTTDFLPAALSATAVRHGLVLECISAGYGQVMQESLDPQSAVNTAGANAVLIALDWRGLPLRFSPGNATEADAAVDEALRYLEAVTSGIQRNSGAICILQTVAASPERLFGSLDRALPGTPRRVVDDVNRGIAELAQRSGCTLLDVAGLAETVGLANWHSASEWNLSKVPFAQMFLPLYADHAGRLLGALNGKSRRCLVLDLDNTLWGGVIGDDGLNGIHVSQGDPLGEAHLDLQRYVLSLRERGVVLAVSSKNEDAAARLPFREHADMILREEHFAVFQANWTDKAANIRAIAEELSLGLDSFVFVDDNPFERELVRQGLPQVAVPEMPADPSMYAAALSAAGYFEAATFSAEDLRRASYYEGNARRAVLQQQSGGIQEYLKSLRMEIVFQPFDEPGRARIMQLISKSNQFNLTTRRYTEAEVARLEKDPDCFTLQIRLSDTLGDNGMISVIVCRSKEDVWDIDTWLMSCRVLGRGVEQAVLRELIDRAAARNIRALIGTFRPTDRNKLVERHYAKLGFTLEAEGPDGTTDWRLDVGTAQVEAPPMTVRYVGFATDPESTNSDSTNSINPTSRK
jgi:FkbH-like protein